MAILYAVLLVSIVLTISLSLLNITYKQIVLAAVSRESQVAHFNAWSAVDCIAHTNKQYQSLNPVSGSVNDNLDNPFGVFNYDNSTLNTPTGAPTTFDCGTGGDVINVSVKAGPNQPGGSNTNVYSQYSMTGSGLKNACAIVDVIKVYSGNYDDFPGEAIGEEDSGEIMVTALGYNSIHPCNEETNTRLVERRIRKKL
ncbi:MAG: hypothetical protein HYT47_00710 [Candidatus Vogelbacteria bacterium]|nr:hypothetical protein [Candidatus Vogelbacteria bacterium]